MLNKKSVLNYFMGSLFALILHAQPSYAEIIVYRNAIVWNTQQPDQPFQAFVVDNNRFVHVGDNHSVLAFQKTANKVIDLKGKFVVPGFIDSHVHFMTGGYRLSEVQLRDAKTQQEFIARIEQKARQLKSGEWITGGDWDHEHWGGELPDRAWIDKVTPDNPVWISRLDGHMALANSLALKRAGIDESVQSVAGGEIVRRDDNNLSGIFKDNAMPLVAGAIPSPTQSRNRQAIKDAMAYVNSFGVTSVVDMADFDSLEAIEFLNKRQQLTVRIYSHVPLEKWNRLYQKVQKQGRGDKWHQIGGLKAFVDGSLGSHTAAFFKPYTDTPDDRGFMVIEEGALLSMAQQADARDLRLSIHAIGDRAIHTLLNVYEKVIQKNGKKDRRFRIEHAQHIAPKDISRFAKLDVIASMQPYHAIDDGRWAEKVIGDRIKTTYAFHSLLEANAKVAFGSDWFVAPPIPMMTIYAAVTRRTLDGKNPDGWVPKQKVTVAEAINAHTIEAAYASFSEKDKGSIEPGKLADFVILSGNLLTLPEEKIKDVKVLHTFVDGERVYSAQTTR